MTDQEMHQEMRQEVHYETLRSEEILYGPRENKFIEISRKRAPDSSEFFMISKGFYNQRNEKRYQKGVGFPYDTSLIKFVIEKLNLLSEAPPAVIPKPTAPKEAPKEEAEEIEELSDEPETEKE